MASTPARMSCILVVTLLIGGCSHRVRVATPMVGPETKSSRAADAGGKQVRDAIRKLRESLRHDKPGAPVGDQSSSSSVPEPESASGDQPVGTSGKWVVTTIAERADSRVTSSTTQTIQRSRPQPAVASRAIRRGWPVLAAVLAVVCFVALRSLRRRAQNG